MHDQHRLESLIDARHPCIAITTREEDYALNLIKATTMHTGHQLWMWTAVRGVYEGLFEGAQPLENTEHLAAALYHFSSLIVEPALCVVIDSADHLDDGRTLRALREVIQSFRGTESCLILLDYRDTLPQIIESEATALELSLPTEKELEQIIRRTLKREDKRRPVHAKLRPRDLRTMIRNLRGLTRREAEQTIVDCINDDRTFDAEDINTIFAHKRQRLHRSAILEYIEAPVDLSSIGGLRCLKRWLKQRRNALSQEARDFGVPPPRGVLLLGVQGAGKSLSAKAIAAAWQRPLLRLDPGVLYDRYIGESERRLREALRQAEAMAPVILWIDEIEKGFASAASQSTDGGLSQRMFATFLTWMQEHEEPVFLVATANNIDALPPELLRKGRFDEIFFVDLPDTSVRRQIFEIHLAKRDRDPEVFDIQELAKAAQGFSGAEIEQAIIAALHTAFADSKLLDTDRILAALNESPPLSVTAAERIQRLRSWAKGRCMPAD